MMYIQRDYVALFCCDPQSPVVHVEVQRSDHDEASTQNEAGLVSQKVWPIFQRNSSRRIVCPFGSSFKKCGYDTGSAPEPQNYHPQ